MVKGRQITAIRDAFKSAERYFKLTLAMDTSGNGEVYSKSAAEAFKTVAVVWLLTKRKVAQLAYILTSLNMSYLGIIWHATGDLMTPAVAALLHNAVECGFTAWEQNQKQGKDEAAVIPKVNEWRKK